MCNPKLTRKSFIVMVLTFIPAVIALTIPGFSAISPSLASLYWPALGIGAICFTAYLIASSIALKGIGRSPWLALTGILFGPIPLILYLVLPSESARS